MLKASNLSKKYGSFEALKSVSFEIPSGSTTLFLGPNGAGKTTVIRCIMGLVDFEGTISIDGLDVKTQGKEVRKKIGYIPQHSAFYENLTVAQYGTLIAKLKGVNQSALTRELEAANLREKTNERVSALSSGMRQKLATAFALINDPPIMIFDEPTSNLDHGAQLEFQGTLRKLSKSGRTILITTHLSGLDEFASGAIVIDKGEIVAKGTPGELLSSLRSLDSMYVRIGDGGADKARELVGNIVENVSFEDGWLNFSSQRSSKAKVIDSLVKGGFNIEDIVIEPSTIESQYVRLLGRPRE